MGFRTPYLVFCFCFSLVSFSYRTICHQSCGVIYYTFKIGRVNRKNGRHVSLGLKARLGLVSMITGEGFPKDNAENRIALINYFLFYVYLIHKNKQRVMSSPTTEVLPRSKYNREPCVGSIPATPGCSRDVSSRPSPRPARPPGRPPSRPVPAGRSEADAHRGLGLVAPEACSRLPAGPRPRQPALLTASRSAPAADHPGPALFTSRFSRSHSQMLPRGSPAARPGHTGFQAARTGPSCGRSGRSGRGLTSLSHLFPSAPSPPAPSPPRSHNAKKLSLRTYQDGVSYQQLPQLREPQI